MKTNAVTIYIAPEELLNEPHFVPEWALTSADSKQLLAELVDMAWTPPDIRSLVEVSDKLHNGDSWFEVSWAGGSRFDTRPPLNLEPEDLLGSKLPLPSTAFFVAVRADKVYVDTATRTLVLADFPSHSEYFPSGPACVESIDLSSVVKMIHRRMRVLIRDRLRDSERGRLMFPRRPMIRAELCERISLPECKREPFTLTESICLSPPLAAALKALADAASNTELMRAYREAGGHRQRMPDILGTLRKAVNTRTENQHGVAEERRRGARAVLTATKHALGAHPELCAVLDSLCVEDIVSASFE